MFIIVNTCFIIMRELNKELTITIKNLPVGKYYMYTHFMNLR